jgi:hypothetical protein
LEPTGGPHDFDFLVGRWTVLHRILKARLAGSVEWETCAGTTELWPTMGGEGNMDDNIIERAARTYRAMSIRAYDRETRQWSIWWIDARNPPASIEPAVRGGFEDGVGTFFAQDTLNGQAITGRFIWSEITSTTAHWRQAFSADGGATWETN